MNRHSRAAFLLFLALLSGCQLVKKPETQPLPLPALPPVDPNKDALLNELTEFLGSWSKKSWDERLAACRALKKKAKTDSGLPVKLQLLFAQVPTEGCGGVRQGVTLANSLLDSVTDQRVRALVLYQKDMLGRIGRELDRHRQTERRMIQYASERNEAARRLKSTKALLHAHTNANAHRRVKSKESEQLKDLQHKLDALTDIERSLDEPNEEP